MTTQRGIVERSWRRSGVEPTALGGMIALAAAIGIGRFVYTPIVPAMIEGAGLSRSSAGLIASANFLGYLLGALLAAGPKLVGPRRAWLLGALAASAVTTGAMAFGRLLAAFLILRFIGGAASAAALVLSTAVVLERITEARRPGLAALHFAGVGVGIAVSAALTAGLQHAGGSWQSLWLAAGILSLLAVVSAALLVRDDASPRPSVKHQAGGPADQRLRVLVLAYGLFGFGYVITATFLVVIVRHTPSIHALEPAVWIAFGLAAAPSVALWNWISTRLGISAAFALASLVEASGVLASVFWPGEAGVFLAAFLVGGTFMGLTALGLVRARALASGDPQRALALMTSAFGLGQIVGPVFAGVLADTLGGFAVPSVAAAVALLIAGALVLR